MHVYIATCLALNNTETCSVYVYGRPIIVTAYISFALSIYVYRKPSHSIHKLATCFFVV